MNKIARNAYTYVELLSNGLDFSNAPLKIDYDNTSPRNIS